MRHLPFLAVLFVSGHACGAPQGTAAELCIEDWSTAVPVVKEERLTRVETVMALAKSKIDGDVVKVTLCQQGRQWVYRLLVRAPTGRHSTVIVDAKEPFRR